MRQPVIGNAVLWKIDPPREGYQHMMEQGASYVQVGVVVSIDGETATVRNFNELEITYHVPVSDLRVTPEYTYARYFSAPQQCPMYAQEIERDCQPATTRQIDDLVHRTDYGKDRFVEPWLSEASEQMLRCSIRTWTDWSKVEVVYVEDLVIGEMALLDGYNLRIESIRDLSIRDDGYDYPAGVSAAVEGIDEDGIRRGYEVSYRQAAIA